MFGSYAGRRQEIGKCEGLPNAAPGGFADLTSDPPSGHPKPGMALYCRGGLAQRVANAGGS